MFVLKKPEIKTFDFKLEGSDKVYSIPLLSQLPLERIRQASNLKKDSNDSFDFINGIFEEHAKGLIETLNSEQYTMLIEGYFEASSINLGE